MLINIILLYIIILYKFFITRLFKRFSQAIVFHHHLGVLEASTRL